MGNAGPEAVPLTDHNGFLGQSATVEGEQQKLGHSEETIVPSRNCGQDRPSTRSCG